MKRVLSILLIMLVSTFQVQPAFCQRTYEVSSFVETLEVGAPVNYRNLTIIPVYATRTLNNTNYATLDEALRWGWLTISETGRGSVNEVMLTNHSSRYIYVMGGEILTGCRQDRIVERDVLIAPRSGNVIVPVYCVEEGRWSAKSNHFYSKNNLGTFRLRALAQKSTANAQESIWGSIRDSNSRLSIRSNTHAYQDAYDSSAVRSEIITYERKFQYVPDMHRDTVGVVVAIGGQIVSADIFANPQIFRKLWPKILRSSAFSTINEYRSGYISQRHAADFLSNLRYRDYYRRKAIDSGEEFSASNGINVNVLAHRNNVLHLAAFYENVSYPNHNTYMDYHDSECWGSRGGRIPVIRR